MPELYLLRHAKSSWKQPELADHDRPLAGRGRRAAKAIGRHLREREIEPELVLCSTAKRARQTLAGIEPALGRGAIRVESALYGAAPSDLLALLHDVAPSVASVMVIGHNPGLEDLVRLLTDDGFDEKFPTGALATLAFSGPGWATLDSAELVAFVRPRDLDA